MFTVSAGGYHIRHQLSFTTNRPLGFQKHVLLIVKCKTNFTIDGEEFCTGPDIAILIQPNIPYQYYSVNGEYINDWLHFSCSDIESFYSSGIPFHKPISLSNPQRFSQYIQQILWEKTYSDELLRPNNISMLMQVLINNLILAYKEKDNPKQYNAYYPKLQEIRFLIQAEPYEKIATKEIADSLGISCSYFQHLYTEFFGVSFHSDLISMKVEYAKNLIRNTDFTIEHIAEISGYSSEVHFYRQFRAKTGMTPKAYQQKIYDVVFNKDL